MPDTHSELHVEQLRKIYAPGTAGGSCGKTTTLRCIAAD